MTKPAPPAHHAAGTAARRDRPGHHPGSAPSNAKTPRPAPRPNPGDDRVDEKGHGVIDAPTPYAGTNPPAR
jgi:hypothetical protein